MKRLIACTALLIAATSSADIGNIDTSPEKFGADEAKLCGDVRSCISFQWMARSAFLDAFDAAKPKKKAELASILARYQRADGAVDWQGAALWADVDVVHHSPAPSRSTTTRCYTSISKNGRSVYSSCNTR